MTEARGRRFRVVVGAALLLATLFPAAGVTSAASPGAGAALPADATSWIVTLKSGVAPVKLAPGLAKTAGGKADKIFGHALNGFVFKGSAKAAAALRNNPNVRTIVADGKVHVLADTITTGISRIRADHPTEPSAYAAGFRGAGVRVAILDTGIDLTHPDLVPNLDIGLGRNCITTGPPQDGHGHGTHVAGIIAAAANGLGVVGVAPEARLVPFKVLDDTGNGEWSNLICAIDYLTGLMTDGNPNNDIRVANMSLGDTGSIGSCTDGGVREAICRSVAAGVVYVAAAGNSTVDASTFIPAAFPEVITVSALTDLDGEPGGLGGCWLFFFYCDDTLAEFSNYGAVIDVAAPGTQIYSDWTGGGYATEMGTSMAAPHVAGVAALVLAAHPTLTPADVEDLLKSTGECPNGEFADEDGSGNCTGKGQWGNDPDGYGEPLVNALHAAAGPIAPDARPVVHITAPADGTRVTGSVLVTADATDDLGVAKVEFFVDGTLLVSDTNGSDGWSTTWDTTRGAEGIHALKATATDTTGHTASHSISVSTGSNLQGDWVGTYGADGYVLAAWNSSTDLAGLPAGVTYVVERGSRYAWASSTTEVRALQSPDRTGRRAATWYDGSEIRIRLNFGTAYGGNLHLYALEWDAAGQRENITVDDGSGPRTTPLTSAFNNGVWIHVPITVAAGGSVLITGTKTAGANALLSGLFLGDAGTPPSPRAPAAPTGLTATAGNGTVALAWSAPASDGGSPITGYTATASPGGASCTTAGLGCTVSGLANGTTYSFTVSATNAVGPGPASAPASATPVAPPPLGDWVGTYGADGYVLAAWNSSTDLAGLPAGVTYVVERGSRYAWASSTTEVRALQSPDRTGRRAATWYDGSEIRIRLNFGTAYGGNLHLYALEWDAAGQRENITVDDGSGPRTTPLTSAFNNGVWIHVPITVAAGGSVLITGTKTAGANALLSGLFLGDAGTPPSPRAPAAPTGLTATAGNGTVALAWSAPASDGGSPITGYTATASPGGASCTTAGLGCTVSGLANGTTYSFTVSATNAVGPGPASAPASATPVAPPPLGDWVGTYGADGYVLAAWNSSTDLAGLPAGVTYVVERGSRYAWASSTTEVRALQSPDRTGRRAATWYDGSEIRIRLNFGTAYGGNLHLYALEWDAAGQRENITVDDGSGPRTTPLTSAFNNGVWIHVPITVAAGGSVLITGTKTAGANALLSGLFLGDAGTPPPPPPPPGNWVGTYGANGHVLAAWNDSTDLVGLPSGVTYIVEQASRHVWASPTTEGRALESPDRAQRRAATWYDGSQIRIRLNFAAAFTGNLHLYALEWEAAGQREDITVDDGSGPRTTPLTSAFNNGVWIHVPISVAAGGSVLITANKTAGLNALLSGLFLDAVAPPTAPGAPTGLTATAGNAQVALAWSAPASNGGSPITGYTATASPGGASCTTAGLGCTVSGLANGTTYSFTVSASNAVGPGPASAPVSATPVAPPTAPGAPTGLTATAGNAQVALAWSAPASNGGSPITGYTATASPGGASCTTAGPGCTVSGLANGTTYSFTVSASNAVGPGPASAPVSATPVAPPTAPGAPTGLTATAGNAQVALAWSAPASNGGSPITGYTATASPGGASCTTAGPGCTVSGLANGTTYSFTVSASNAVGPGPASAPVSATPVAPPTAPGAPTGLTATAGNAQVALAWSAPASDGGSPITGYTATASPGGASCTTAGPGCTVSGLANGTTYSFTVSASNAVGPGPASAPVSATPVAPPTAPGAPTGLTATAGNAQVALAWSAPASNGGSPITGYSIYRGTASGGETLLATVGAVAGYTDTGLTNGTTYYYQVTAQNATGASPRSAEVSARPATVPTTPRSVTAARNATKGVTLTWVAPLSNGGAAVTGYRIYRSTTSGAETFLLAVGNVLRYVDTATTAGVRHYYQVSAVNAAGEGPRSTQTSAIAR